MGLFKKEMEIDEILKIMNGSGANTETIHAGPCFLQYKLQKDFLAEQDERHQDLLNVQNGYNRKQLFWTRFLVVGTWLLVAATLLLKK